MQKPQRVSTWSGFPFPDWDTGGGQADTDHLRLHRCRRTSPWQRCGRLPTLTGPSGCGTFVPQCGSLRRCRAHSPAGRPADHWETDREQANTVSLTGRFCSLPSEKTISLQFHRPSGMFGMVTTHMLGLTPQNVWDDQKRFFTRRCAWICWHLHSERLLTH